MAQRVVDHFLDSWLHELGVLRVVYGCVWHDSMTQTCKGCRSVGTRIQHGRMDIILRACGAQVWLRWAGGHLWQPFAGTFFAAWLSREPIL